MWRQDELETLAVLAAEGTAPQVIAAVLGRTERAVRCVASRRAILLIPPPGAKTAQDSSDRTSEAVRRAALYGQVRRRWSEEEGDRLRQMTYKGASALEIAEELGRSEGSVRQFSRRNAINLDDATSGLT